MIKKMGKLTLILIVTLILAACSGNGEQEAQNSDPEIEMGEPVALVNGEKIYEVQYERMTERMLAAYEQQGISLEGDEGEAMLEQIQQQTLDQMIQQEVLLQEAESLGLSPSEESVEEELDSIRSQFDSDEEYKMALEQNRFSENELKETLVQELSIEAYLEENMPEITITDDELQEYYNQYKAQQEEQIKAMEESEEEIPQEQLSMMEVPAYNEIKEDLKASLTQQKEQEQIIALIDELMEKSDIEILL